MPDTMTPPETLDAVTIGAGFSGMYQLHLLRDRAGHEPPRAGSGRMEATAAAADAWGAEVNRAAEATLLPQASSSWYLGANVPGKPRVFMPYAGGMAHYARLCADVAAKGCEGFALTR